MNDIAFGDLVVRMLVSLTVVLGLVLGAYAVLRRRRRGGSSGDGMFGPLVRRVRGNGAERRRREGIRVLGRAGLGRTTSAVAVQFADRVLLLGVNDHAAPTVLGELGLDDWGAATDEPTAAPAGPEDAPAAGSSDELGRIGVLEALRNATLRRG